MCIYKRVDLLYFGYCSYLGGESITVQTLCVSGYRQFVLLDTERMTGYGYFGLLDVERITGYRQISCVYPVDPQLSSKLHYLTPFPRYQIQSLLSLKSISKAVGLVTVQRKWLCFPPMSQTSSSLLYYPSQIFLIFVFSCSP